MQDVQNLISEMNPAGWPAPVFTGGSVQWGFDDEIITIPFSLTTSLPQHGPDMGGVYKACAGIVIDTARSLKG